MSLGIGMALGVLLGLDPDSKSVLGVGTVTLGIGGGPLDRCADRRQAAADRTVALEMPLPGQHRLAQPSALAIFLLPPWEHQRWPEPFVRTVSETGMTLLLIGVPRC